MSGGLFNIASSFGDTVGGGSSNTASGIHATVGGGNENIVSGVNSTVGGGSINNASGNSATVGGGILNDAAGFRSTVGGGIQNTARGVNSTVGGGIANLASGDHSTVGGGNNNTARGAESTVAGGGANLASGDHSTVGGGELNTAGGAESTVAGGVFHTASGLRASVGGGEFNTASGFGATIPGGSFNVASGLVATVPGGSNNFASGDYSFAAGRRAKANHAGAFVWADSTGADFASTADNQFNVRASGGTRIFSNSAATLGAVLLPDATDWSVLSDRAVKANFSLVDGREVLNRLVEMPIETWNYQAQDPSIRHMGPMAQDFYAAFQVGMDERYIGTLDADGVALAAIQGLHEMVQEKDAQIVGLETRLGAKDAQIVDMETRLEALERAIGAGVTPEQKTEIGAIPDNSESSSLLGIWTLVGGLGLLLVGLGVGVRLLRSAGGRS